MSSLPGQAAEQGSAEAKYLLSQNLINGFGLAKDVDAGVALLQQAAAAGHPQAQYNLAVLYKIGRGVAKDVKKADQLLGQAALNVCRLASRPSRTGGDAGLGRSAWGDEWAALYEKQEQAGRHR